MTSLLRRAMEGRIEPEVLVMKGPLGEAMTAALNVVYAKTDPVTGEEMTEGRALESQAQEVAIVQQLVNAVNEKNVTEPRTVEVYAVSQDDVSPDTVVDVVGEIENSRADEYIVVADASAPSNLDGSGEVEDEVIALEASFEVEKGAFHKWLGKKPGEKITNKDIEKGLASKDAHVKKMAQFAKNMKELRKKKQKKSLEALKLATEALGGKFYFSLEEYVESMCVPVNPETKQEPGQTPENVQDNASKAGPNGEPAGAPTGNTGADGAGPGDIDHVSAQIAENGAAQPGAGQTDD